MTSRLKDEAGFTLVEMLIAVVVLGMIVVALGAGFSVGVRTMNDTSNRLSGSNDAQQLGVYLPPDVQSATTAITTGIACTGLNGAVAKLQLTDSSSPAFNVVYGLRTVTNGFQLERYICTGGAWQSTIVVGRNLTSVVAARIPTTGTLAGASLTVTEKVTTTDTTAYVFTVTGRRRTT